MLRVAGRKSSNAVLRRSNHDFHHLRTSRGNPCLASLASLSQSCRTTPDNRLLSTLSNDPSMRQIPRTPSTPIHSDFATNLIPSYPLASSIHSIRTRITTRRIGIRHLTTDKNNNNNKDLGGNASSSATPNEIHSGNVGKVIAEESSTTGQPSEGMPQQGGVTNLVGSVGKRVNERLGVGDKLSVYGIVGLIGLVMASPFIVRYVSTKYLFVFPALMHWHAHEYISNHLSAICENLIVPTMRTSMERIQL